MSYSLRLPLALSLCLPLAGCPDEDNGDDDGNDATTTATSSTTTPPPDDNTAGTPPPTTATGDGSSTGSTNPTTTATSTSGTTSGSDDNGDMPPIKLDNPPLPDAPPFDDDCGNVDFLFVIDNSGSMGDEQASLIANFPAFITGIQTVLDQVDTYQVGVVTTDAYTYNVPGCNNLSSLVVQTGGANSSNMACGPYAAGDNFMTEADDLPMAFACAAQVGTVGSASERAMQATVEAVTKIDGGNGMCNEGFIRDDALLVIVIITDEPDNNSVGTVQTWYDDVVMAKGGFPENVVVVSFINTAAGGCGGGLATDIEAFTNMFNTNDFSNGFPVPICAPDYAPFFQDAIALIDIACDNFMPPN